MDEFTRLRAELDELNLKCQTARDNEVRYALQRSRLEAERAKLLVRMMETMAPTSAVAPTAPYRVVVQAAPVSPTAPTPVRGSAAVEDTVADAGRVKPAMVEAVLQDAPKGLRPCEIRAAIQKYWWPDAPRTWVSSVVWHMGQKGRLAKNGSLYRLAVRTNGHGHHKA